MTGARRAVVVNIVMSRVWFGITGQSSGGVAEVGESSSLNVSRAKLYTVTGSHTPTHHDDVMLIN